jgi:membrane peptidoglycan carboxypeptidase
VQDQLVRQLGVDRLRDGGLRVRTTLDLDLQRQAEAGRAPPSGPAHLRRAEANAEDPAGRTSRRVDNAAAVVLDSATGEILAMVGSPDYFGRRSAATSTPR